MTAPLHERLEAQLMRDSVKRDITPLLVPSALIREAAAALRPPEGEVGALCERFEGYATEYPTWGSAAIPRPDVHAALAHLRRLAAVEASVMTRDELRAILAPAPAAEPAP